MSGSERIKFIDDFLYISRNKKLQSPCIKFQNSFEETIASVKAPLQKL